jgi:hypothetical protein
VFFFLVLPCPFVKKETALECYKLFNGCADPQKQSRWSNEDALQGQSKDLKLLLDEKKIRKRRVWLFMDANAISSVVLRHRLCVRVCVYVCMHAAYEMMHACRPVY